MKKESMEMSYINSNFYLPGPRVPLYKTERPKTANQARVALLTQRSVSPARKVKKSIFHPHATSRDSSHSREEVRPSLEDFTEFEKVPLMVKTDPREKPQIADMNRVLADKIKKRYRSTDRFCKIHQVMDGLSHVNHDMHALDHAFSYSKRLLLTKQLRSEYKAYPEEKLQADPVFEIQLKEKLIKRKIKEEKEKQTQALNKFYESQRGESRRG